MSPYRSGVSGSRIGNVDENGGSAAAGGDGGGSSVMDFFSNNTQHNDTTTTQSNSSNNNNMTTNNTTTASNYLSSRDTNNEGTAVEDVTTIIRQNYNTLLTILSNPEVFTDAMEWQTKLDAGIDPLIIHDEHATSDTEFNDNISFPLVNSDNDGSNVDGGGITTKEEEEEDEDSTFKGLDDGDTTKSNDNNSNSNVMMLDHIKQQTQQSTNKYRYSIASY